MLNSYIPIFVNALFRSLRVSLFISWLLNHYVIRSNPLRYIKRKIPWATYGSCRCTLEQSAGWSESLESTHPIKSTKRL